MALVFTKLFMRKFTAEDAKKVDGIYCKYFTALIEGDVRVNYTRSRYLLGKATVGRKYKTILLKKIVPHTVAHELMHLAQGNGNGIPHGERACDVYTNALGEDVCDHSYYIKTHSASPELIHQVCKEAVEKRNAGLRNYISWAEDEMKARSTGASILQGLR